jgi:hypothetical protein
MTEPIAYHTPNEPLDFRNRKGMLLAVGIVMIIFGVFAGCLTAAMPFALVMQPPGTTTTVVSPAGAKVTTTSGTATNRFQVRAAIVAMAMYAAIAVGLIWTGIGSILARRWVRPIVLTFGTLWLVTGVAGTINGILSLPMMGQAMRQANPAAAASVKTMVLMTSIIGGAFMLIFLVVLPALVVWLFSSNNVLRTVQYYDPNFRWTDRCPLPVLAMSLTCGALALGVALAAVQGAAPVFGRIVTGAAASVIVLSLAAVLALAAVLVYRQRRAGWMLGIAIVLLFGLSSAVTMFRLDSADMAAAMGSPPEQIQLMRSLPTWHHLVTASVWAMLLVAGVVYAWRIRHHFDLDRSSTPASEG